MMGEPGAEGQEISAADEQGFGQKCTDCDTRNRAWGHVAGELFSFQPQQRAFLILIYQISISAFQMLSPF
jgi:hypothetical protein